MEDKANIQHNKLMYLEDTMIMYGVYFAETLEKLVNTVHITHNNTIPNEKIFAGDLISAFTLY